MANYLTKKKSPEEAEHFLKNLKNHWYPKLLISKKYAISMILNAFLFNLHKN